MTIGIARQGQTREDAAENVGAIGDVEKGAIIVIDKRALFRDCLVRCLRASVANRVVLDFASRAEWQEEAADLPPPALVLFCNPTLSDTAVESARELELLYRACESVPLVLISDSEDVDDILLALQSGARGYVPTSLTLDVAVGAIHLVEAGGIFAPANCLVAPKLATKPLAEQNGDAWRLFTARQAAVVQALRQGKPNKQIAYELNMRESTVKLHVRNIMKKLKVKNRTEAAILTSRLKERLKDSDGNLATFCDEEA
jgi:DNA-binding NarL/FixJ family response regulator